MAWLSPGLSTVGSGGVAPRLVRGDSVSVGWLAPAGGPPRSRAISSEKASRADCSRATRACSCSRSIRPFKSDARKLSICPRSRRSPTASAAARTTSTDGPSDEQPLQARTFEAAHRSHHATRYTVPRLSPILRDHFTEVASHARCSKNLADARVDRSARRRRDRPGQPPHDAFRVRIRQEFRHYAERIQGAQVPIDRTRRRRTRVARRRRAWRSGDLLRRHGLGRRVEIERRRATWNPIFDDQPISSIGSIAVAPSNPNVVYVGSGEANIRGNVAAGNGIYKSADAGKTWTHVWKQEGQIGTMVVHPADPDIAFAAVLGHAFGPNPERGVYRTTDGGKTWRQVLKKDDRHRRLRRRDDPSNPSIVFAGFWQTRRLPWDLVSGGPGSGLHVSRDGGETWKQLTGEGLPDGIWGKVGVAIAPSDGRRVYALIEAEKGGLFRSDDGGASWQLVNASRALRQRAWYYSTLTVNPSNRDEVWFPQVPMLRTIDGGKTLQYMKGIHHGDHHDVWFDPKNPKRMIAAQRRRGRHLQQRWRNLVRAAAADQPVLPRLGRQRGLPITSLERCRISAPRRPRARACAAGASRSSDWHGVGGGEAGHVVSERERSRTSSTPANTSASSRGTTIARASRATSARGRKTRPDTAAKT